MLFRSCELKIERKSFSIDKKLNSLEHSSKIEVISAEKIGKVKYRCMVCRAEISEKDKICPQCKTPIDEKVSCSNCGEEILESATSCPECGTVFSDSFKCPDCGKEIFESEKKCTSCGCIFE